jgi:hypothetical protein
MLYKYQDESGVHGAYTDRRPPGGPSAGHNINELYRAPFAAANNYPITQYFPVGITHLTPDSYYAIDLEIPIGTGIYAARGGIRLLLSAKQLFINLHEVAHLFWFRHADSCPRVMQRREVPTC